MPSSRSPSSACPAIVEWLVERLRARAAALFGLPDGEDLRVSLVRNQPWSAYNWYDGGRRSRVDVNVDLPMRVPELLNVMSHEAYPGHHLEHGWKEADLVDGRRTARGLHPADQHPGMPHQRGPGQPGPALRRRRVRISWTSSSSCSSAPASQWRPTPSRCGTPPSGPSPIAAHRHALAASAGNAAFLRHADGRPHAEVLGYLEEVGRFSPPTAAKRLEFIEHPLLALVRVRLRRRRGLLATWLEAVPEQDRVARFGRLLHEQLTPSLIRAPG